MPTGPCIAPKPVAETALSVETPRVGVAVLVTHAGKLLLGQRTNPPQPDSWQCPGGFLNPDESVFDCARRKAEQEAGIGIQGLVQGPYTSNRFEAEALHTVTLYVLAELSEVKQAEKFARWHWCDPSRLPEPRFLPLEILVTDYSLQELLPPRESDH